MPLAVYPSILAGQDLTAALLSGQEQTAWKSGDTPRASATALTADPDLSAPLPASSVWKLHFQLIYEAAHSPGDLNIQWALPSGSSLTWSVFNFGQAAGVGPGNLTLNTVTSSAVALAGAGAGTLVSATGTGLVKISSAEGSLTLTWAQFASSATPTIMHTDSNMTLRRVA